MRFGLCLKGVDAYISHIQCFDSFFLQCFGFCPCGFIWRRPLPQKFGNRAQLLTSEKRPEPTLLHTDQKYLYDDDDDDDDDVDDDDNDDDDEIHLTNSSLRKAGQFKRTSCFFFAKECLAAHNSLFYIVHQAKGCMHHFLALFTANFF